MNHKNMKHILERKSAKNGDEQNELEILGANQRASTPILHFIVTGLESLSTKRR